MHPKQWVVDESEQGQRVDRVLAARLSGFGRRLLARLFQEGRVRLDSLPAKKGAFVHAGQHIEVELPPPDAAFPEPELELTLLLVRHDLVVADKPAGMPSAALRSSDRGTLAGALLGRFPEMAGVGYGPREPGLVHRLDTFTSGLVLAARNASTFDALRRALSNGQLVKRYLAIAPNAALPDSGVIETRLGPHPNNRRKVMVMADDASGGRHSRTEYCVLERRPPLCLVELTAGAAYRHQIRAHLASEGSPILGDQLYGAEACPELGHLRHALHASQIRCDAADVANFEVTSRLPADMAELWEAAR